MRPTIDDVRSLLISRRGFLLGAGGVVLAGCGLSSPTGMGPRAGVRPRTDMVAHRDLAGVPLVYEDDGAVHDFLFDEQFHGLLVRWFDHWCTITDSAPTAVRSYGAWIDGTGAARSSWHHMGRAFDLTGIVAGEQSLVSCREDRWSLSSPAERAEERRRYWRVAASLHQHFQYVLTYFFDDLHHDHIHIDNAISGAGPSVFSPRSRVQNQAVAAISRYLWGIDCPVSGRWDRTTQEASGDILRRLGRRGTLTDGDNWSAFLTASVTAG